jgi:hypothetical protein
VGRHLVDCCGGEWDVPLRLRPVSGLRVVQGQQRQAAIHCDAFHSATELSAAQPHALATQQDVPFPLHTHTQTRTAGAAAFAVAVAKTAAAPGHGLPSPFWQVVLGCLQVAGLLGFIQGSKHR